MQLQYNSNVVLLENYLTVIGAGYPTLPDLAGESPPPARNLLPICCQCIRQNIANKNALVFYLGWRRIAIEYKCILNISPIFAQCISIAILIELYGMYIAFQILVEKGSGCAQYTQSYENTANCYHFQAQYSTFPGIGNRKIRIREGERLETLDKPTRR